MERGREGGKKGKGVIKSGKIGQNGKVHLGLSVCSSVHNCGCVVDGSNAMAVIEYYYY